MKHYWREVRLKARELGSDGCTGVPDFYLDCCLEHDIHWRTGRTLSGKRISPADANRRFKRCIQARSKLGKYSPMAQWRYLGVTITQWWRNLRGYNWPK